MISFVHSYSSNINTTFCEIDKVYRYLHIVAIYKQRVMLNCNDPEHLSGVKKTVNYNKS